MQSPHNVSGTEFLNALDRAPSVFEPLSLEAWLALSLQRNTHPLCILFSKQCKALILSSRPNDLGLLTLRQLSKLSEDLLFYEQKEHIESNAVIVSKRDDIKTLVESRIGRAGATLFMMMFDEINKNIIQSIRWLLHGKREKMESALVDALIVHNEDLASTSGGTYSDLLTSEQKNLAKKNIIWVDAFKEYLPRLFLESLGRLQTNPTLVKRGEHTEPAKLSGYGKQLAERFLYGVCLLPENHRLNTLHTLVTLGSRTEAMVALRSFTGQSYLLANVPLSLTMSILENSKHTAHMELFEKMRLYINGEMDPNWAR